MVDNGLGISKDRLAKINSRLKRQNLTQNSHIGLYNTNMRLVLTYGPEAAVCVNSKDGQGTVVHFSIPVKKEKAFSRLFFYS